ncbi:MAG: metallophosphoesterase [Paludibacter sp.]
MKKNTLTQLLLIAVIVLLNTSNVLAVKKATNKVPSPDLNGYNFMIANDMGRNGYYDQKPIATQMGEWAGKANIEFVAAAGDEHHFNGVASVNDPLWMTNFELIYTHPELMLDWYPILGNHEYRGNTQAVLDYSNVSRRWVMPARYYTMVKKIDKNTSIRLVFVDTAPLIDKYRNNPEEYPDACKQDYKTQLHFIDSVLSVSTEKWKVVIGHHPVYAYTPKDEVERTDMQARLDPLLRKYKVDFYVCGHIHNFQHITQTDSPVDYIVNSSASGSRPVKAIVGTKFCNGNSGFSICSVTNSSLSITFINALGESIYSYKKEK